MLCPSPGFTLVETAGDFWLEVPDCRYKYNVVILMNQACILFSRSLYAATVSERILNRFALYFHATYVTCYTEFAFFLVFWREAKIKWKHFA